MDETHPFVQWWMNYSRWHQSGEDWKASLCCSEGRLAIEAWNAAIQEASKGIAFLPDVSLYAQLERRSGE